MEENIEEEEEEEALLTNEETKTEEIESNVTFLYNQVQMADNSRNVQFLLVKSSRKRKLGNCSSANDAGESSSTSKACRLEQTEGSENENVVMVSFRKAEKDGSEDNEEEGDSQENYTEDDEEGDYEDGYYEEGEDEESNNEEEDYENSNNEEGDCDENDEDYNYDENYDADYEENDEENYGVDNHQENDEHDHGHSEGRDPEENNEESSHEENNEESYHEESNEVRDREENYEEHYYYEEDRLECCCGKYDGDNCDDYVRDFEEHDFEEEYYEEIGGKNNNKTNKASNVQVSKDWINPTFKYNHLIHIFKYLTIPELAQASRVCKEWYFNTSHPYFWKTLIMKNFRVRNWPLFVRFISTRQTKRLDLSSLIIPRSEESQLKMWNSFCRAIPFISKEFLISVDMGRCTPNAFVAMAQAAPQLKSLSSTAINGNQIDTHPMKNNCMLKELVMKPFTKSLRINDFSFLASLNNLISLALTGINNLSEIGAHLPTSLVYLELGDCTSFSKEAILHLSKLENLKRLRLVKGQNPSINAALVEVASTLPKLYHLELINLDIRPGFEHALAKCTNLSSLLIAPTYFTKRATTSSVLLSGVQHLKDNLDYFVWVVTVELLKIADTIIRKQEKVMSSLPDYVPPIYFDGHEHIPILKEVVYKNGGNDVKIVHFTKLYTIVKSVLPKTRIQIRRTPYCLTWSQTVFKRHEKKKLKID